MPAKTSPRQRNTTPVIPRWRRKPVELVAVGRSLSEFEPLAPAEKTLMYACRRGVKAEIGTRLPAANDEQRSLRASFVRFLLLGGDVHAPVHETGVQLVGAAVQGTLDLTGCETTSSFRIEMCRFTDALVLQDARVRGYISLSGSYLPKGIDADRLECTGDLILDHRFAATDEVRLVSATIGGDLDCTGGRIEVSGGDALSAHGALVKGSVFLNDGFEAKGTVGLTGARIGKMLACRGGLFSVTAGYAISADGAVVEGNVFLDEGFSANGEVRLLGMKIGDDLSCRSGEFVATDGDSLSADGAVVQGSVLLSKGFRATGGVRLLDTKIGGYLICSGGRFEGTGDNALLADHVQVDGYVLLNDSFTAKGTVRLVGARIGGNLECAHGEFEARDRNALAADHVIVKENVFLNNGFKAKGAVRLLGAQIGGDFLCGGGLFEVNHGDALSADGMVVSGNVSLDHGFKANGGVRLVSVKMGRDFSCAGGEFDAKSVYALNVQSASVLGVWFFEELRPSVRVDAAHMKVGVLADDTRAWGKDSALDGFRFGAFAGSASTLVDKRIAWLRKQSDEDLGEKSGGMNFRPQPWRQLQSVLREMGHAEEARQVSIAFQKQLRTADRIGRSTPGSFPLFATLKRALARGMHSSFGFFAGYGYQPMRLLFAMFVVWLACGASYWYFALPPKSAVGPSDPLVFQNKQYASCAPAGEASTNASSNGTKNTGNWYLCESLPAEYSTFSPLVYSLDVILPLVDLGQEKAWGPLVPTPKASPVDELTALEPGHVVRLLVWFETLVGWIGSLLFVAIVSGVARRIEE